MMFSPQPNKTRITVRRCVISSPIEKGFLGMATIYWPGRSEQVIYSKHEDGRMATFDTVAQAELSIRAAVIDIFDQHFGA